jgi:hypothetical protein
MSRVVALVAIQFAVLLSHGVANALACPPPPRADGVFGLAASLSAPGGPPDLTDLTGGDPFYYTSDLDPRPTTTHSKIPHLPVYTGYMQTNDTFRFVNVVEQVFTMIGEGKHGLWRVQEAGTIREYRKRGTLGLPAGANLSDPANFSVIQGDYSHYLPAEGSEGYKDPSQRVDSTGRLNFIDLPITHRKYRGRYRRHVPIDLAHWYCTMSEEDFPYARQAMEFAFAQPGANRIGPLGKRAGLDIKELYTNVVRLHPLPDARVWVNVGDATNVRWKAIDARRTRAEVYVYERPFFNAPYLFLTVVLDNKGNRDFRYVRPDGPYYKHLRGRTKKLQTAVTLRPRFHLTRGRTRRITGTRLYGVHHPNRPAEFGDTGGGACPQKGGDWDGYPDTKGGAGWPTQYEEVTPLCDGVLVDIKFFANLDGARWNSESKNLANAGVGRKRVTYTVKRGLYGRFTDPYHTRRGVKNPQATSIGPREVLKFPMVRRPVGFTPVP